MPMVRAQEEGVKGFVKGGAQGLGGAVIKPISGAFDLVAKTTAGAHSMVDYDKNYYQNGHSTAQ